MLAEAEADVPQPDAPTPSAGMKRAASSVAGLEQPASSRARAAEEAEAAEAAEAAEMQADEAGLEAEGDEVEDGGAEEL